MVPAVVAGSGDQAVGTDHQGAVQQMGSDWGTGLGDA
jgi:hypothetical protein